MNKLDDLSRKIDEKYKRKFEGKKENRSFYLDAKVLGVFDKYCKSGGQIKSWVVETAISEYLEKMMG